MTAYVDKNVLLEAMAKLQPSAEEYGSTDNRNKIPELEDAAYWTARDLYDDIKMKVTVIDSADVTAVVRCSECKNFKSFPDGIYGSCTSFPCRDRVMKTTDYCSYGESKESEDKNNDQS